MSPTTRLLLFLCLCIPLRSIAAFIAYKYPESSIINILAILYIIMGLSMLYLFLTNQRQNAPEGGGITWWNNLRPIHAILYLLFALAVFLGKSYSYIFLIGDVLLGLGAFTINRLVTF